MRNIIESLKVKARRKKQRIVLPEGTEERILKAAEKIVKEKIAVPYLIGDAEEIKKNADNYHVKLEGIEIRDPEHDENYEKYWKTFYEMRKHKGIDEKKAKEIVMTPIYFGTMMVHLNDADGLVGGSTTSTADTLRPALQIIKTHEKFHKVSSVFLMILNNKLMFFADCAVEIEPDAKDLADIALDTAKTAISFGHAPKVAMLSFSTNGSARHPEVDKVKEATAIAKDRAPDMIIEGEMQVDAAIVPEICERKFPGSKLHGDANVMIFPTLNAANCAYK
ncbi:phosphate acetyltransferase, partial [Candidatus Woesearchaeota archaeon]|nr:phosphate acetyltransferase [Candidatus Woesearchaeota archaeon]